MGEIAEALRRSRGEQTGSFDRAPTAPRGRVRVGARTAVAGAGGTSPRRTPASRRPARPEPQSRRVEREGALLEVPRTRGASKRSKDWAARAVLVDRSSPIAESFRHFAIRVRRLLAKRDNSIVLVTSAVPGEGKTVTACNLALALASMAAERHIALVDLDLRRAGVAAALGIKVRVGMERVLWGESPLRSARAMTDVAHLDVFGVEAPRRKVHELLSGERLGQALEEIAKGYDTVVIDTPPVLLVPDVPLIAPHAGAIVTVARAGSTRQAAFEEMLETLPREKVIGGFLNEARRARHSSYYAYGAEE